MKEAVCNITNEKNKRYYVRERSLLKKYYLYLYDLNNEKPWIYCVRCELNYKKKNPT